MIKKWNSVLYRKTQFLSREQGLARANSFMIPTNLSSLSGFRGYYVR